MDKIIMSIGYMDDIIANLRIELIAIGYDQADSNDDLSVDLGDAIRILLERPAYKNKYTGGSLDLLSTIIKIRCRKIWDREFPNGKAQV